MESKDNSKVYLIIIAVLLFIIGIGVGYFIAKGSDKNEVKNNTNNIQDKKDGEKKETVKGKLDVETLDSSRKVVTLNGNDLEITYKFVNEPNGPGTNVLSVGDNKIGSWSPNGIEAAEYEVFVGEDNKEYLLLTYTLWSDYGFIINDEGKTLYKFSNYADELDCVAFLDDNKIDLNYVKDNAVYYYRYREGSVKRDNYSIVLDLVKLSVNNDKVSEAKTGEEKTGKYGQCS